MFFQPLRRRRDDPRTRLQYPLIWLLLFALQLGLVTVLRQNQRGGFWEAGLGVAALMTIWGIVSARALEMMPRWQRNPLAYRAAELIAVVTLMRLITWLFVTPPPPFDAAGLRALLRDPSPLFDNSVFAYSIFAIWCWQWAGSVTDIFGDISLTEYELRYFAQDTRERRNTLLDSPQRINRQAMLQNFFQTWIYGGIVLVTLAAFSTIALRQFPGVGQFSSLIRLPLPPAMLTALLLYLFTGLWLLAYGRSIALYARWIADGVQSTADFARRWRRYGLLLLLTVGLLASLLPIGTTLPLAQILGVVLEGMYLVMTLFLALIVRLFALVSGEITGEDQETIEELLPQAMPTFAPPDAAEGANRLPPELWGGLTIAAAVIAVALALVYLARTSRFAALGAGAQSLWERLRQWWRQLWGEVQARAGNLRQTLLARVGRPGDKSASAARRPGIDVNELTPREQVRYYYIQAVERAEAEGVPRRPNATPAEFLRDLQNSWPESATDSEQLTTAFLHARYSPAPVEVEESTDTRAVWQRVRKALRRARRSDPSTQQSDQERTDDQSGPDS